MYNLLLILYLKQMLYFIEDWKKNKFSSANEREEGIALKNHVHIKKYEFYIENIKSILINLA